MSLAHILETIPDRQRESLYENLKLIYLQLDQELSKIPRPCTQCGACCDFKTYGHKLYICSLEFAYVSQHLGCNKNSNPDLCPYLKNKQCTAREHRMIGCRTFFRLHEDSDAEKAQDIYEVYLNKLKTLYKEHEIPWEYKDFMVFVEEST